MARLAAKGPELVQALMTQAKPRLATFMKYAAVELSPPTPADIPRAISGFRNVMSTWRSGRVRQITVKEAWLNTLVGAEICFWFFIGEIIGRRHFVGYNYRRDVHH